jgi:hypothetical protein
MSRPFDKVRPYFTLHESESLMAILRVGNGFSGMVNYVEAPNFNYVRVERAAGHRFFFDPLTRLISLSRRIQRFKEIS